jgi:mono/diheme cytochrome c family protein
VRALLFTLLVLFFLFFVPFLYFQQKEFPARPREFSRDAFLSQEKAYREERVEAVLKAIPDSLRPQFENDLKELRSILPKERNNELVARISQQLKDASLTEASSHLTALYITWEPDPEVVEKGRVLYQNRCMTCHGRNGDGIPVTPEGLKKDSGDPIYPRDFTGKYHKDGKVVFKYSHRGFGHDLAYLEDLRETIRRGLPGTPMPGFPELTEEEVSALLEYIRSLAYVSWKYFPADTTFPAPVPPPDLRSSDRVARGRALFAVCSACHGNQEQGGEPIKGYVLEWYAYNEKGEVLKNEEGKPIMQGIIPRHFRREPLSRPTPEGIYTTIRYGLGGTPMTGFSFPDEQIWDLVSYILWLRESQHASP